MTNESSGEHNIIPYTDNILYPDIIPNPDNIPYPDYILFPDNIPYPAIR